MDDSHLLARSRPTTPISGLQSLLNRPSAPSPLPEEAEAPEALPRPEEGYQAHGRIANRPLTSFLCLMRDASVLAFQYSHLDSRACLQRGGGGAQIIMMRFAGSEVTELRLEGRNLGDLFHYLMQHRMPWACELPAERDYTEEGETVIHRIDVRPVAESATP